MDIKKILKAAYRIPKLFGWQILMIVLILVGFGILLSGCVPASVAIRKIKKEGRAVEKEIRSIRDEIITNEP